MSSQPKCPGVCPYIILQVPMHASMEVIRNAWRKQSLKNHPDKLVNAPKVNQLIGEERMKRINNAYEILHDPILRAQHDRVHPPAPQPQTGMI
ncbi:DnaJ-domain-containing protein, partial [Decorospora gaudefroyi]